MSLKSADSVELVNEVAAQAAEVFRDQASRPNTRYLVSKCCRSLTCPMAHPGAKVRHLSMWCLSNASSGYSLRDQASARLALDLLHELLRV